MTERPHDLGTNPDVSRPVIKTAVGETKFLIGCLLKLLLFSVAAFAIFVFWCWLAYRTGMAMDTLLRK